MLLDGIWAGEIYGIYGWESTGILILEDGHVLGGGNHHYSTGTYKNSGSSIKINMIADYFGNPPTIFGDASRTVAIRFRGKREAKVISGTMSRSDKPKIALSTRYTKIADLPEH
jgi:hypothetical protein